MFLAVLPLARVDIFLTLLIQVPYHHAIAIELATNYISLIRVLVSIYLTFTLLQAVQILIKHLLIL